MFRLAAKPPTYLNREHFVIGLGGYDTLLVAGVRRTSNGFEIVPRSVPFASLFLCNAVIGTVAVVCCIMPKLISGTEGEIVWQFGVVSIAILTIGVITGWTIWRFWKEDKLGPWLMYHSFTQVITLPRQNLEFPLADVVHIQDICTQDPDFGRGTQVSELNLVAYRDGQRQRWNLLKSLFSNAFDDITTELLHSTPIPVVRIRQKMLGRWEVELSQLQTSTEV